MMTLTLDDIIEQLNWRGERSLSALNAEGRTLLMEAIQSQSLEKVEVLLKLGVDPNQRDTRQTHPLEMVLGDIRSDEPGKGAHILPMVTLLLDNGVSVETSLHSQSGVLPFLWSKAMQLCSLRKHPWEEIPFMDDFALYMQVFELFLSRGARLGSDAKQSAFYMGEALTRGAPKPFLDLIEATILVSDKRIFWAHHASQMLFHAAPHLSLDSIAFLLNRGASTSFRGGDGNTVLHHLARIKRQKGFEDRFVPWFGQVMELLNEHKADWTTFNYTNNAPIHGAVEGFAHSAFLDWVVQAKRLDLLEQRNGYQSTAFLALMGAGKWQSEVGNQVALEQLRMLIDVGVDVSVTTFRLHQTGLHLCEDLPAAQMLVAAGLDPLARNEAGRTPLEERRMDSFPLNPDLESYLETLEEQHRLHTIFPTATSDAGPKPRL